MIQDLDSRLRPFAPVIVMAVGLVVFIRTLMPGIAFGDWGEMQVVPHVLGIAHPTGYPTYVLLAWTTELIPIGSVAFRANLLSAVCISAAMGLVTAISLRLAVRPLIAIAAGLAFGAVGTVWAAATVAEVNPLHALFAALMLYVALDWEERPTPRNLALGGLIVGLALGNHLLTVVIAPFVAVFVLWTGRAEFRRRPGLLVVAPAMVLLGLAVYLYIPIRAAMDPPLAYNHPKTLDGVLFLVTGEQFRGQFGFLSGDGPAKFLEALPDLAGLLAEQATPILPIAGVIGLGLLVRRRPAFGLLCVAVLIGSAYAYSTYLQLEHYLLVPFLVLALGGAVALEALAGELAQPRAEPDSAGDQSVGSAARRQISRLRGPVVVVAGVAFAIGLGVMNWQDADRSGDHSGTSYAAQVMTALPPGSAILSQWDLSTPLWYAQLVEGVRPDVTVIDDTVIVYDGWGTREAAITAAICDRPVFIVRLDEDELAPTREAFNLEPFIEVPAGIGTPTAIAQRTIYRVTPSETTACPT